jgi:hypothetical protein
LALKQQDEKRYLYRQMKNRKSVYIIVAVSLFVGLLHFITGPDYKGPFPEFVQGYLIDLLLPMNLYLLLQVGGRKHFSKRTTRIAAGLFTVGFGTMVELLQYYKIDFLGSTYDPWDIVMYVTGTAAGILIDLTLIEKLEKNANPA